MTDTLKYQNHLLISQSHFLSECCCGSVTGRYWESVPCPLNTDIRDGVCAEWDQCQFADRVFVNYENRCGGTIKICEAQRLRIQRFDLVSAATVYTNVIKFDFLGGFGTTGQVVWGTDSVTITATGFSDVTVVFSGRTCSEVVNDINTYVTDNQPGMWSVSVSDISFTDISSFGIEPETLNFTPGSTFYLDSKTSGLYLSFNDTEIYVVPDSDLTTFIGNLQSALQSAIGAGMTVTYNDYMSDLTFGYPNRVFDIIFGDALCGIDQGRITTLANVMPGTTTFWYYHDSNTTYSYFDPTADGKQYVVAGTGSYCGYEMTTNDGPAYYNGTQCCPQKGVTMGANQNIYNTISGYCLGSCLDNGPLDNLENTFYLNNRCYSLTKSFFLFGMDGRLQDDFAFNRQIHITPDCDYPSACDTSVPSNCTPELFLPLWNKNVPWGPFGSYYKDIELDPHPAWTDPYNTSANPLTNGYQSFLSSGFPVTPRSGWHYRPQGWIKTLGEWTETKEIGIYCSVLRPIPFAVGDREFDDIDQYIEIDPATVDPSLTVTQSAGAGCGPIQIGFFCSGKTVGEYLDAINALEIKDTSGCKLFGFCAASDAARAMPASKIINTSSELFESNAGGYSGDVIGEPLSDDDLRSGSSLVMPKAYTKYFYQSLAAYDDNVNGYVTQYYQPIDVPPNYNAVAVLPPFCRALAGHLPRNSDVYGTAVRGNDMWWTSIPTTREDIVSIGLNSIDPSIDPMFTEAWVKVVTGRVTLYASGLTVATTGINTKPNATYTLTDLANTINGLSFTWTSGTYSPFIAVTGLPYEVYLDDVTSIAGASYTYDNTSPSTYNFSYREPLRDLAQTPISLSFYASLQADLRRRCNWGALADQDPRTPHCVPPDAERTAGLGLNCDGDVVIDGDWVIGQGCLSPNCLTQWYIPATRCGCDTVKRCHDNAVQVFPHPFNQSDHGLNNSYWSQAGYTNTSVYQPLLYVCEYDFHPECDIPCMVKVPFVVIHSDGSIHFQNGTEDALPGKFEFCGSEAPILSNNAGWCQYFDPSTPKVMESEIPRAAYPLAFVATRSAGAFCSTNAWNFNPYTTRKGTVPFGLVPPLGGNIFFNFPDGCVDVGDPGYASAVDCSAPAYACFSCGGWDRICNLGIVYENVVDFIADPTYLCALFRPIIKNQTAADVCSGNSYGCNRIDIDCATACCECGFTCSADANCYDTLKGSYYTRTVSYALSYDIEGGLGCDYTVDAGNPLCLAYAPGVCIPTVTNPAFCNKPICYTNGKQTVSFDVTVDYNITSCGCDLLTPICANETTTYTPDCGYSITCGAAGCVSTSNPSEPPPTMICYDCSTVIGCPNLTSGIVYRSGIIDFDCGDRTSWGISETFVETTTTIYNSTVADPCDGAITCDWNVSTTYDTQISNGDPECQSPLVITYNGSTIGSYDLGSIQWDACGYSTSATAKDIDYIYGWNVNHGFACGYGSLFVSASGEDDPRFFGPYCTGV